ncbi:uncharacterized protein F5891DRAFT_1213024 [Suillus fuscotomentosus]|uniref:Uncharacterized protein n=1 Tax=Suillus fuscotomentosus TaxID=1912939 RepID=A0AAD4HNJ3_9AGAM|nr:uncharacterized protein F5891DRAFT_1213024 [Suillus fuscotomentosus]KAG1903042.1 hypothetical protein F5891DRAFT_1213024 [Suillus fuscotomentosus]
MLCLSSRQESQRCNYLSRLGCKPAVRSLRNAANVCQQAGSILARLFNCGATTVPSDKAGWIQLYIARSLRWMDCVAKEHANADVNYEQRPIKHPQPPLQHAPTRQPHLVPCMVRSAMYASTTSAALLIFIDILSSTAITVLTPVAVTFVIWTIRVENETPPSSPHLSDAICMDPPTLTRFPPAPFLHRISKQMRFFNKSPYGKSRCTIWFGNKIYLVVV